MYIRDYPGSKEKWVPGIVTEAVSRNIYRVHFRYGYRVAQAEQLKKRLMRGVSLERVSRRRQTNLPQSAACEETVERRVDAPLNTAVRRSSRKRKQTERMEQFLKRSKKIRVHEVKQVITS